MLKPRFLNAALGFIGKKKKIPGRVYSRVFKNAAIRLVVELRFLQTQLKAYLELRFCKRSLKKRSYTARFFCSAGQFALVDIRLYTLVIKHGL